MIRLDGPHEDYPVYGTYDDQDPDEEWRGHSGRHVGAAVPPQLSARYDRVSDEWAKVQRELQCHAHRWAE